jgi:hypothetical protein
MSSRARSRYCVQRDPFDVHPLPVTSFERGEQETVNLERGTLNVRRPPRASDVDALEAVIAERLERAGVALPEAEIAAIAEEALAEAVRISLAWLEQD